MQTYSMQQLNPVQETIRDGLVMGARYSVVVSVNTSGGMSTSSRMFFAGKSSSYVTSSSGGIISKYVQHIARTML